MGVYYKYYITKTKAYHYTMLPVETCLGILPVYLQSMVCPDDSLFISLGNNTRSSDRQNGDSTDRLGMEPKRLTQRIEMCNHKIGNNNNIIVNNGHNYGGCCKVVGW